jgi:hypothetical protein
VNSIGHERILKSLPRRMGRLVSEIMEELEKIMQYNKPTKPAANKMK